jgi:phage shock protein A
MSFRSIPEAVSREWFDTEQAGPIAYQLPDPDLDYAYAAARLLSFYPVVNTKGATYFREDVDDDLLNTLVGKQANLQHDKTRIIGTIFSAQVTEEGIDIGVRIDRECANLQGMDLEEMRSGNYFSHVSVELTKDPELSWFYAIDDEYNVIQKVPVTVGKDLNIRRTTTNDPYRLMGNRVVERIKPARFTGVGFVPNPADRTAALYAVAASEDSEDTEKPIPPELGGAGTPVSVTTDPLPSENNSNMNDAEALALRQEMDALKGQIASLTAEKEQASAEAAKVGDLTAKVDELTGLIASKETELASVTTERDSLKAEKETAAQEAKINSLVGELVEIYPAKDDAELAEIRETAAKHCGEDGVIRTLKAERKNLALEAKIAELTATPVQETPVQETPVEVPAVEVKPTETASAEDLPFVGKPPEHSIGPTFTGKSAKGYSKEELYEAF